MLQVQPKAPHRRLADHHTILTRFEADHSVDLVFWTVATCHLHRIGDSTGQRFTLWIQIAPYEPLLIASIHNVSRGLYPLFHRSVTGLALLINADGLYSHQHAGVYRTIQINGDLMVIDCWSDKSIIAVSQVGRATQCHSPACQPSVIIFDGIHFQTHLIAAIAILHKKQRFGLLFPHDAKELGMV